MLEKIISGGQTGADQGGLEAGKELGLETGGWAPYGWRTENGPEPILLRSFGLHQCPEPGYAARTKRNIEDSDGTLIVGRLNTPGTTLTFNECQRLKKPFITNPKVATLKDWLVKANITILNVAGNRESKSPGIQEEVRELLVLTIKELINA